MSGPERLSTTYALRLDPSTTELLASGPLGAIEDVPAIQYVRLDQKGSRLLYVVLWGKDNDYVHKALHKKLRIWIHSLNRASLPTAGDGKGGVE